MRFFLTDTLPKVGYGWSICDRRDVEKLFGRAVIAACCLGVVGLELQPLGLGRSYTQVQFFELLDSNVLRVFKRNCFILFLIASATPARTALTSRAAALLHPAGNAVLFLQRHVELQSST